MFQTDATEIIFEAAKKMPEVDANAVLVNLANYRSKSEIFSKTFLWSSVSKMSSTAWWKGFCSSTQLSKLAVRFLELPATSAACERTFSTYGGIHTQKRNRLKNERATKIVYIAHNLKLQKHEANIAAPNPCVGVEASSVFQPHSEKYIGQSEPSSSTSYGLSQPSTSAPKISRKADQTIQSQETETETDYEETDSNGSYSLHDSSDDLESNSSEFCEDECMEIE